MGKNRFVLSLDEGAELLPQIGIGSCQLGMEVAQALLQLSESLFQGRQVEQHGASDGG